MDRINGAGHVNNLFVSEDVPTNRPPTEITEDWLNSVQEELVAVVLAAGLPLNPANSAQVLEAVQRLIDAQSGNYALDTGAANAYVVALNPAITAYGDGMTVRVKAINANNGASTLNAGGGVVPLVNDVGGALAPGDVPAGGVFTATYIASANKFYITSLVPSQSMTRAQADALYQPLMGVYIHSPRRQTVTGGAVDANGAANFLSIVAGAVKISATAVPVNLTFAAGFDAYGRQIDSPAQIAADVAAAWSVGANVTNGTSGHLWIDRNAGTGALTYGSTSGIEPVYDDSSAPSVALGAFSYRRDRGIAYYGTGAAAPAVQRIIVGEYVAAGGVITSVVTYALNGIYVGPYTATLPGLATVVSQNHYIGLAFDLSICEEIECTAADNGYAVGDVLTGAMGDWDTQRIWLHALWKTSNAAGFTTFGTSGGGQYTYSVLNKATGIAAGLTLAKWKYRLVVRRNW